MNFRDNFLYYILSLLIIFMVSVSYYRFIIKHDYVVLYEGVCDPALNKCFVGCEDDECTKKYFYSRVVKNERDLYMECGKDITDCKAASVCFPNDRKCSVTFCDKKIDGDLCDASINKQTKEIDDINI